MMGGLGNQLFIANAADAFQCTYGVGVTLDFSEVSANLASHGNSTHRLFERVFETKNTASRHGGVSIATGLLVASVLDKLPRRISYRPSNGEVGFDEEILSLSRVPRLVRGFFQSYKYSELGSGVVQNALREKGPSSSWAMEQIRLISGRRVLGVHLRRGDYWAVRERLGVLNVAQWFMDGSLSKEFEEILIFSDDTIAASALATQIGSRARAVKKPSTVEDMDELLVMSSCSSLAISNSTFSWWAASIAEHNDVYFPSPWFRGISNPADLTHPAWKPLASNWM